MEDIETTRFMDKPVKDFVVRDQIQLTVATAAVAVVVPIVIKGLMSVAKAGTEKFNERRAAKKAEKDTDENN